MFDITTIRQDTDLSANCIHFNNAGGSLATRAVTQAMINYLTKEAQLGAYETAQLQSEALKGFYQNLASYLNCQPHNIAYATSATTAFNRGLDAIDWQDGDIILTTKSDYVSNHLYFLQLHKKLGVAIEIIPEGQHGFDPLALADRLANGPKPKLLSVTHIPTNSGRVQDIITAGKLARQYDILYAVDACQSAGQLPLDVQLIACDFMSATFRKYMRGPRGTGFLYVSDRVLNSNMEPRGMDLQGAEWTASKTYQLLPDARRFETWERNMALQLGAALATDYLLKLGIDAIHNRTIDLANKLSVACERLASLQEHCYFASQNEHKSGILLFNVDTHLTPTALKQQLHQKGLNVSIAEQGNDQYHFREKGIDWAMRMSVHYYNTEAEIEGAVAILKSVLG